MKGYRKLRLSCAVAARQCLKYIWIDTCCIDKRSSAELSEAINSMFRYYKEAEVCDTYLSDVVVVNISAGQADSFDQSAWFTRGWTLQELIAPKHIHFYNKEWNFIGTKADLKDTLGKITKIPESVLLGNDLGEQSVSRKMSWVSLRQTTVPEDIAYCLLGLFGVNIPLLYEEGGENAFLRLQEAILKSSDDESIFSWRATEKEAIHDHFWGLLARSPTYFSHSPDISTPCITAITTNTPATLTSRGLYVELLMALVAADTSESIFAALFLVDGGQRTYGVLLQKMSYSGAHFVRVGADVLLETGESMEIRDSSVPPRILSSWGREGMVASRLGPPQALRFYVRQKPNIPSVVTNEAVGISFRPAISLPPELSLEDWTSGWSKFESWEAGVYVASGPNEFSGPLYVLDFAKKHRYYYESKHIKQNEWRYERSRIGRSEWTLELLGALQLTELVDGSLRRLTLLIGLEHTLVNSLNNPIPSFRPWYLIHRTRLFSSSKANNANEILEEISARNPDFTPLVPGTPLNYAVSFDLHLRYGRPYYLIRIVRS